MISKMLEQMMHIGASDLFITAGFPPSVKLNGAVTPISKSMLSPDVVKELVTSIMSDDIRVEFEDKREANFAISQRNIGRFRVSAFYQRNWPGMVLRRINTEIPDIDTLDLPKALKDVTMEKRGIVLLVGATGTGKSTTLAAMIGYRNKNSRGHIITIEDPIEFVHQHDKCIVTQREVGQDTDNYEVALKNTLRQAPDVIMIGEIRSRETMDYALAFAETGHLVFATLHANNANQALDRIIHFFPADRHDQMWMDLSLNLRGIIAQQLVPTLDGEGRKAAIEVLLNSPLVGDHIRRGEVHLLKDLMKRSRQTGMQTFDQSLYELYVRGEISYDNAIIHSDSPNDLRLMIKLENDTDAESIKANADKLSIQEYDDEE